jgi:hypothetical protein
MGKLIRVPESGEPACLPIRSREASMPFSVQSVKASARTLIRRHGLAALRRAEGQIRRMEQACAFEAARTWKQLTQAIREILEEQERGVRRNDVTRT